MKPCNDAILPPDGVVFVAVKTTGFY
jgi:hypothetical protein